MKRYFGAYGGVFVPEGLVPALTALESGYKKLKNDNSFKKELETLLKDHAGRETPLHFAKRLSNQSGNAKIYLKREDLVHTGSHKMNSALGQALLASRMGKTRIIAESGSAMDGIAAASAAARLGLECGIYIGASDAKGQEEEIARMEALGAKVGLVKSGSKGIKDAIDEALRDYSATFQHSHYLAGSAIGPYPYPSIVRDFQCVIGREAKKQILKKEGRLPDFLVASVGGGSGAIGLFTPFIGSKIRMVGVEAGGDGKMHAQRLGADARPGVVHGMKSLALQDPSGQVLDGCSAAAGLRYPAVGPELAAMKAQGKSEYVGIKDEDAIVALRLLSKTEGIVPSLESAHALAHAMNIAKVVDGGKIIIAEITGGRRNDIACAREGEEP